MTIGIDWGSVADWVSGLGSFAAVVVALHLARASEKVKLKPSCGIRVAVGRGREPVDLVMMAATNVGIRATIVQNVGFRTGLRKSRKHAVIVTDWDQWSHGVPKLLNDGESAAWGMPVHDEADNWIANLTEYQVTSKADIDSLEFVVSTNNGGEFYAKVEQNLKDELLKVLAAKDKAGVS